jgi:membrane protease YdiL (CAAX protease family)
MPITLESLVASTLATRSLAVLIPYVAVGLTVNITVLNDRRLRERFGDATGMWIYFVSFFVIFLAIPVALLLAVEKEPLRVLAGLGAQPGRAGLGLVLVAIAVPVTLLISAMASKEPAMREQYPFSKAACASDGAFVVYEAGYLLLYYTAWEFLYRGLLFFPLMGALGFPAAAAITTALSTVHHIGHPDSEVWGALGGGLVFSLVAILTGSFFYAVAIHALMGIGNDSFIYARFFRGRTGGRTPQ